jgi:hypothetical protein
MSAIKRNDMQAAQRIVDEAAKEVADGVVKQKEEDEECQ